MIDYGHNLLLTVVRCLRLSRSQLVVTFERLRAVPGQPDRALHAPRSFMGPDLRGSQLVLWREQQLHCCYSTLLKRKKHLLRKTIHSTAASPPIGTGYRHTGTTPTKARATSRGPCKLVHMVMHMAFKSQGCGSFHLWGNMVPTAVFDSALPRL